MTAKLQLVKSRKVPTLESGAALLLLELSDADVSIGRVVQLVEMSPAIAAKLISCANSPWSKPVSPITKISEACARLGLNVVRTTTIALSIGQAFDPNRCPSFDAQKYWCTAIIASSLAADLAPAAGVDPSTARTCALLNNIGLLWLADALPGETDASLRCATEQTDRSIGQCLQDNCGSNRQQASLHLYKAWNLPETLQRGIDASDSNDALAHTVALAETLATEIYDETPVDESSCPGDDDAMRAIYGKQYENLEAIRDLAATLF
jgi:HD-like signal output (HDOD) protein